MASPAKVNLTIFQGSTFLETLRWESSKKIYKQISNITKSAPVLLTSVGHGIPEGWRVRVTNVAGMKEINSSTDEYYKASIPSVDTLEINSINATSFTSYTSGGILEYNEPIDLAGFTARMQIRQKVDSAEILIELTTENGGVLLDNNLKTITLVISAVQTAAFSFSSGVYSLELISSGGVVTPLINGSVSVKKEVTR